MNDACCKNSWILRVGGLEAGYKRRLIKFRENGVVQQGGEPRKGNDERRPVGVERREEEG
eukprot:CAMPEP_0184716658 /NCGR_PEP_ID=MMETSP0314-20130426/6360_1 /TAXON_ID=38298 /ORGANISM="Rhodella maculata, Strain CCMP 736" /LENGTH=59 /DNA_ID=CAMNT_0027180109 /DNA_START=12 /DNA_END=187 /DNA_ORIENTATION=+